MEVNNSENGLLHTAKLIRNKSALICISTPGEVGEVMSLLGVRSTSFQYQVDVPDLGSGPLPGGCFVPELVSGEGALCT